MSMIYVLNKIFALLLIEIYFQSTIRFDEKKCSYSAMPVFDLVNVSSGFEISSQGCCKNFLAPKLL